MKFKHEKKTRFYQVFHEKTVNNFLNSEQKIIYAKKRANNFINDLCKIVEIVYTEKKMNNFYEKTMNNFN